MKKNRFDVLRKLVGAKPETDEEWFEAVDKYEDDIENHTFASSVTPKCIESPPKKSRFSIINNFID